MVSAAPVNLERIAVDGRKIAFLREGEGEPVLLVHGITTYSFIWRKVIPLLAERYEVFAPDLLGCGDSDKPLDVSYSLKAHADRLVGLMDKLGIGKVHFVGHDLGGGMGQIVAATHPARLHDLAMVNTVAYDYWPVQPIVALRTPVVREFLMACVDVGAFILLVRRGLYHKDRVTDELMELFVRPLQSSEGRKAFLHFARCLDNTNLMEIVPMLRALALPVLIVRGDADPYLSATIAERLHAEIPGSQLRRIATASHFLQEDEPGFLAGTLLDFWRPHR